MSAQTFMQQLGQYPEPWTYAFDAWYYSRINYLAAYCKKTRGAKYYINNSSGLDSNNGTSPSTPWKTLAKVQANMAPNTEYSFACGSEWNETVGLTLAANVSLTTYGSGQPPFFNAFNGKITSGWTLASGTTWQVAAGINNVAYFRLTGNAQPQTLAGLTNYFTGTLGANLFPLWAMSTLAACEANIGTWYFDSATSVIYFNTGNSGTAPPPCEYLPAGLANGVLISQVDGCYVAPIRIDGFGMSGVGGTGGNSENMPFYVYLTGTQVAFLDGVQAYYSDAHLIGFLDSPAGTPGGILLARNCQYGFSMDSSSGNNPVIVYSDSGGQEVYLDGIDYVAGGLPVASPAPPANGYFWAGQSILVHGAIPSLVVVNKMRIGAATRCLGQDASQMVLSAPPALPSPANAIFIVKGTRVQTPPAGIASNLVITPFYFGSFGTIWVDCEWEEIFDGSNVETYSGYAINQVVDAGWMVNCDMTFNNIDAHSVVSLNVNGGPAPNFQNFSADFCRFTFKGNWNTGTGNCFLIEHPTANVALRNCDLVMDADTVIGSGHYAPISSTGNAYTSGGFTMTGTNVGFNDPNAVTASSVHPPGYVPLPGDDIYAAATMGIAGGIYPDHDIDGNPRNLATPNIGPREVNAGLQVVTTGNLFCQTAPGQTVTANIYPVGSGTLTTSVTMTETPANSGNYVGTATIGTPVSVQYVVGGTLVAVQTL